MSHSAIPCEEEVELSYMRSPERRQMEPAEEYLIAWGETVRISMPNRAQLEIRAG